MMDVGENDSGRDDQEPQHPAISRVEFEALAEMIGTDMPEILVDLLETYREESAEIVRSIVTYHESGNDPEMLRPVHSLKSSSASIGAMHLSHLCSVMENYLRGAGEPINVNDYVNEIKTEFDRVDAALEIEMERLGNT